MKIFGEMNYYIIEFKTYFDIQRQLLSLLSEPRIEILSALSIEEEFILGLWRYVCSLGPLCGLKSLLRIVQTDKELKHPIFDVFYLLCSLVVYLVTIFDENEFYVKQCILSLDDYKQLADFLNQFIYHLIADDLIDLTKSLDTNSYFSIFHQLLTILYNKDNQRSFTGNINDFWINRDTFKLRQFLADLEREKVNSVLILNKIPHVINLKHRIEILQNRIKKDKHDLQVNENTNIRVKVRRNHLVDDAFSSLANLNSSLFKNTFRVLFVNEFGLNEAGIDQDGVFKEFLQDLIKRLLNPDFNLFKMNSEQQLYPSPSSYYVDDHLKLFEFVGRLIGKSIYESQVVDVEFAPFFLRQLIGFRSNNNYSFLDDLSTLDNDLYKNLSAIKYDENVGDLELTFSHSEFHLGKLITHELVPNGCHIKVTNDNKIRYIHLLSHFKLHKQIREQVAAFNEGFKSIIKKEWVNMFSMPEVQRLISGSCSDINFIDLK
jgi:ubiquitin-protein ligase E3 B